MFSSAGAARTRSGVWAATSILIAILIGPGCAPETEPEPTPEYLEDGLGLSEGNHQTVIASTSRYAELLQAGTPEAARTALIGELNAGGTGVEAKLSSDGTTIRLKFDDGSISAIDTDEVARIPVDEEDASKTLRTLRRYAFQEKALLDALARTVSAAIDCPGIVVPSSTRVKIIGAATVTNPSMIGIIDRVEQVLIDMGWTAEDIDVWDRLDMNDKSLVPDDMLNHTGYGLVILMGHGGVWESLDGQEHYHIQCCPHGYYKDVIPDEELAKYRGWQKDGRLGSMWALSEITNEPLEDIYIRDDLFADEMKLDPGAMVYVLACNSWNLQDEFTGHSVGSFMGWEGSTRGDDAERTLKGMLRGIGGEASMTDEQALADLKQRGLGGTSTGHYGETTNLRLAGDERDFYLPSWGKFKADPADVPDGTDQVEATISYADCPDKDVIITLKPGEEIDVEGLIPIEAVVTVVARDKDGKIVGTGSQKETFQPGGNNEVDLETCTGSVGFSMGQYPEGVTSIRVELTYDNPDIPTPAVIDMYPTSPSTLQDLWAGAGSVTTTAKDASGNVLGTSKTDVTVECGQNTFTLCYGWLSLQADQYPPDTASIVVKGTGAQSGTAEPVTIQSGSAGSMTGFHTGEQVSLTAEAFDAHSKSLGASTITATVGCGENVVKVNVITYDIVLTANPSRIEPDGQEKATITATLRTWMPTDGLTPTGDPVSGKSVEFHTSLGDLSGDNPVTTGADGVATIQLSSTVAGTAEVTAVVADDVKEAKVVVRFGDWPYVEDFEGLIGTEWSVLTKGTTPSGRQFLGPLTTGEVHLQLDNLPTHDRVIVSFDLYVIGSWDGDGREYVYPEEGHVWYEVPDVIDMCVDDQNGEGDLRRCYFDASFSNGSNEQSYPAQAGCGGCYPAREGAVEINSLGYDVTTGGDAVYRISCTITGHLRTDIHLVFFADERGFTDDPENLPQSWGIDNIEVKPSTTPPP